MTSPTLLRLTQFPSDPESHGAARRTLQIRELCARAGYGVQDVEWRPPGVPRWRLFLKGLRWVRPGAPRTSHLGYGPGLAGYYDAVFSRLLAEFSGARVVIWETTYDRIFPTLAQRHGFRVAAIPHNLESLGLSHANSRQRTLDCLGDELDRLAGADAIFAIAQEEQWLLGTMGLASDYLPYFPPSAVAARLRAVRARRAAVPPRPQVLVLGNASHTLTADGMRAAIRELVPALPPGWRIIVAGFGSAAIAPEDGREVVEIRGPLSSDALDAELAATAALVTNQIRGAGALTRIPEALLAGIPVLANPMAARSTGKLSGVHVYHGSDELRDLLREPLPCPPEPAEPVQAYNLFAARLRRLAQALPASA